MAAVYHDYSIKLTAALYILHCISLALSQVTKEEEKETKRETALQSIMKSKLAFKSGMM